MGDLHNIINHFTVALLNLGILFELLGAKSSSDNMRNFGWTALRMSLGFAILSLITGFITEGSLHAMVDEAKPVSAYHKAAAFATLALLAASVITKMSAKDKFADAVRGAGVRSVYTTLLIITFFAGSITGYLGMELTYSYGVNVEPYERIIESLPLMNADPHDHGSHPPAQDTFQALPNAPSVLSDSTTR